MQQPSVVVSVGPLKGKIQDADIKWIAWELLNWLLVAKQLGMGSQDIEEIETNSTPAEQRVAFLNRWIFRDETAATYEKLIEVLMSLGEQGAAERIAKLEQQPSMQQPSVGVSVDPLKDEIRDTDIIRIAGKLPNWQLVAKQLDMGSQDIRGIETLHTAPADQRVAFLNQWTGNNGATATYEKLIVALKSLDQQGAAEHIERICKQGQKPPPQPQPLPEPLPPPQPLPPQPLPFPQPLPPPQPLPIPQPLPPPQPQPDDTSNGKFHNIPDKKPKVFWKLHNLRPLDGTGLTIAILDTGINVHHSDFKGKIKAVRSFVDQDSANVIDLDGHGTSCAGIAAGREKMWKGVHWSGVAPGVKIVVCKVACSKTETVENKPVIEALQFLFDQLQHDESYVDVVSLSFGFKESNYDIKQLIWQLKGLGVIIVCAAGNDGCAAGNDECAAVIDFPARMMGDVLCIGAHDKFGNRSRFSPKGRELAFLAPGEHIWAPSYRDVFSLTYVEDGTSFAAPAVAGLICLILQRLKAINPTLYKKARDVEMMTKILKSLSSDMFDAEKGYGQLHPLKMLIIPPENVVQNPNI